MFHYKVEGSNLEGKWWGLSPQNSIISFKAQNNPEILDICLYYIFSCLPIQRSHSLSVSYISFFFLDRQDDHISTSFLQLSLGHMNAGSDECNGERNRFPLARLAVNSPIRFSVLLSPHSIASLEITCSVWFSGRAWISEAPYGEKASKGLCPVIRRDKPEALEFKDFWCHC